MTEFKGRFGAQIVGYVDLVISILFLLSVVLGIAITAIYGQEVFRDSESNLELKLGLYVILVVLALYSGGLLLSIWANLNLVKATYKGADVFTSLRRARNWRLINIVFAALILLVSIKQPWLILILFIPRVVFLGVVHKFIAALESFQNVGEKIEVADGQPPPYTALSIHT